jgi:glycosyl-4,4'-diaponeurosporenoate acyltransferase
MEKLWFSILYVALIGILSNPFAAKFTRDFAYGAFPFAPWGFEKNGRFYEKLGVRKWKDRVPDMSRVLKKLPPKNLRGGASAEQLETLVQETCVAELVHTALIIMSLAVLFYWRGWGAAAFLAVYNLFGNVPFIVIQRYNRPRLVRLCERAKRNNDGLQKDKIQ